MSCYPAWHSSNRFHSLLSRSKQNSTLQDFLVAHLTIEEWQLLYSAVIFEDENMIFLFTCDFDISLIWSLSSFFTGNIQIKINQRTPTKCFFMYSNIMNSKKSVLCYVFCILYSVFFKIVYCTTSYCAVPYCFSVVRACNNQDSNNPFSILFFTVLQRTVTTSRIVSCHLSNIMCGAVLCCVPKRRHTRQDKLSQTSQVSQRKARQV